MSMTNACANDPIIFNSQAAGAISVHWDFGDGQTASGSSVNHAYQTSGQYSVTMTTIRPGGCGQTIVKTNLITIGQPSVAVAVLSDTLVCVNEVVNFDAVSSNIQSAQWSFGDGGSSTNFSASHQYSSPGLYTVELIHSAGGCYDTIIKSVLVTQPTAGFQNISHSNCAPANISFTNTSLNSTGWIWEFSDGQTSQLENPQIVFSQPGSYNAQLIVSDQNGCTDTTFVQDAVVISNNAPAGFQPGSFEGCSPFSVSFFDYSIGTGSWLWNFGDGNTSNQPTPNHVFVNSGDYVVSLSTIDSLGCGINIDTFALVSVNAVLFDTTIVDMNCDSQQVEFAIDCPDCISGSWDFGDGTSSSSYTYLKQYGGGGSFNAVFTGVSSLGCVGTRFFMIDMDSCAVHAQSFGNSNGSPFSGEGGWTPGSNGPGVAYPALHEYCGPITLSIENPVPNAQNWIWHFGDGDIEYGYQPQHMYDSSGVFSIMLDFEIGGVMDTLYYHNFIEVNGHVNEIIVNSTSFCNNLEAEISSLDSTLLMYNWSLNNQHLPVSTDAFDTTFINSNQLYSIVLTTVDSNFCTYSTSAGVISQGIDPVFNFDSAYVR